jgi:hypothetical protein
MFRLHIEMWKHHNDLRQQKSTGFLTANSILVAIAGFLMREPRIVALVVLISIVGIGVCFSWFLLLSRNSIYIEYHRSEAGDRQRLWVPPKAGRIRTKWLDNIPSVAFLVLWFGVLVFMLVTK